MEPSVEKLAERTYCVDGYDLHMPEKTGIYVLDERPHNKVTIIETGASMSVPHLKNGLKQLNIKLEEIQYIIVTHIHLDHAGGAGLLLKDCPNATVIVHPRGKRHLHDPSRLIEGARAIYGESFDELFDPIVPIPINYLQEMNHLDRLQIAPNRNLVFYDTPGHAKHHFSIYDEKTKIFFTGDTIGLRYPELERKGISFYIPSTSPNHFQPDDMLQSLQTIESVQPKQIAFGHFGASSNTEQIYEQIKKWVPIFVSIGEKVIAENKGSQQLKERLMDEIKDYLKQHHINDEDLVYEKIQLDVMISAMGIIDYLQKK